MSVRRLHLSSTWAVITCACCLLGLLRFLGPDVLLFLIPGAFCSLGFLVGSRFGYRAIGATIGLLLFVNYVATMPWFVSSVSSLRSSYWIGRLVHWYWLPYGEWVTSYDLESVVVSWASFAERSPLAAVIALAAINTGVFLLCLLAQRLAKSTWPDDSGPDRLVTDG